MGMERTFFKFDDEEVYLECYIVGGRFDKKKKQLL
jgi:hypothetical protein